MSDKGKNSASKYGAKLFGDIITNQAKEGQTFRSEYPLNFTAIQDAGLAGDVKARAAAVDFLSTMGAKARSAALDANPELKTSLGLLNASAQETGPSEIGKLLQSQALDELKQGGSLTPDEIRNVTQATRAGYSDRGLTQGNPALFSEVLNRVQYADARKRDRQGFASGVDAQLFDQRQGDRSFLQNLTAENQSYDPAMKFLGVDSSAAAAGGQGLTQSSITAPTVAAQGQHDYWNTMFNADQAKSISAANRKAGLESARMAADAASSAGTKSMIGSIGGSALGAAGMIGAAALF